MKDKTKIYNESDLFHYLTLEAKDGHISFHMPGHKGADFFRRLGYGEYIEKLVDMDITEIPGADDLFHPQGVIRNVMDRYKATYQSKETFLSVGGSSAGNLAAILSSTEPGDVIITNKDRHRSVDNAVKLGQLEARYVENFRRTDDDFWLRRGITAAEVEREFRKAEDQGKNVSAVVITSPNYYGMISEIFMISQVAHARGAMLIVDQAHGAHLIYMDGGRYAAELKGADIVINSIHKTLAGFTQTSIVNVCSDLVDIEKLAMYLQMLQTSSPSYMLMSSLSLNIDIMNRYWQELIGNWQRNLDYFYAEASKMDGTEIFMGDMFDRTKLLLKDHAIGPEGTRQMRYLMERNIVFERVEDLFLIGMTGIGNKREDFERLLEVLDEAHNIDIDDDYDDDYYEDHYEDYDEYYDDSML